MDDKRKMNWWIRLGCFLTGWNKDILQNCSEHSFKKLKRVTSGILIISIIWFLIIYKFSEFYLGFNEVTDPNLIKRIVAGLLGVFLIIQIERQIILNYTNIKWVKGARIFLAFLMAFIGATIFDQVIFKDDIERAKMESDQKQSEVILLKKLEDINKDIKSLEKEKEKEEKEYKSISREIKRNPKIRMPELVTKNIQVPARDSLGRIYYIDTVKSVYEYKTILNPRVEELKASRDKLKNLTDKIYSEREKKMNIKNEVEKEIKKKKGFLNELEVMFEKILPESWVAMVFWVALFLFMVMLELLVLFATFGDCDYEEIIRKQKEIYSPNNKEDMK